MATWGDRFKQTTSKRQATPRNQKLGRPRYFSKDTKQPRPSNALGLNNVVHVPDPEAFLGQLIEFIFDMEITSPADGATVPPVHDIVGGGAEPNSEVQLWYNEGTAMVATVTSDEAGNWAFTGDTPAALGEIAWQVRCGFHRSPPVTVTVVAAKRGRK